MDLLKYFRFDHLPDKLQDVSRPFAELAAALLVLCPTDSPMREMAVYNLLLAKDAAVRAALEP